MRLCDVCKEPDPFKRQLAVARIGLDSYDGKAPYKSFDICVPCLERPAAAIFKVGSFEEKDG